MTIPLYACQSGASGTNGDANGTERWKNFDDGSDVLSLDVPYLHSNTDELTFNIVLEKGTLASELPEGAVSLGGALDGWRVEDATRVDDVTIAVDATRPEGLANNGASVGSVQVDSQAIVLPEDEASKDSGADEKAASGTEMLTAQEVNEIEGTEWPDDAVKVDKDIEAVDIETGQVVADTPEEIENLLAKIEDGEITTAAQLADYAGIENDAGSSGTAEGADAASSSTTPGTYEVMAMFVNPSLSVDFDRTKFDDGNVDMLIVAQDFRFDEGLSSASFTLDGAQGCTVQDVRLVNEHEAEVKISLPSQGADALDGATLLLSADSNESKGDVACSIEVPEPWVDLSFDYMDAKKGTVTFIAELNDSDARLTGNNMTVLVDGEPVSGAEVKKDGDNGTYTVAIDADKVSSGSVVTVDVAQVEDLAGQAFDVAPSAEIAEMASSRGLEDLKLTDLMMPAGKAGLTALADLGWKQFCKNVLDPNLDTDLYEVTNNELLSQIVKIQQQVTDLSDQVKVLSNTVLTGQNAAIINDAKRLVTRIKTQEVQLSDAVAAVYRTADPQKREEAAKDFAQKEKVTIDELATNLGELYGLVIQADSATNHDLITVYDEMMAQSYNWGAQTYPYRQQFRNALATVWANGAQIVALAYGVTDSRETYLNELDRQTKDLATLIGTTHAIDASSWIHTDGKGNLSMADLIDFDVLPGETLSDPQSQLSYYCNTTGKWYTSLLGNDTVNKWDKGFERVEGSFFGKRWRKVSTPFRDYTDGKPDTSWDGVYMNTAEAKQLVSKLHDGQTLKAELESVGLPTTKYLVTSEKFDNKDKFVYDNNDWYFDTFEIASADKDGNGFTAEKQHYDASDRYALVTFIKHINWYTSADDLFVLQQVAVD